MKIILLIFVSADLCMYVCVITMSHFVLGSHADCLNFSKFEDGNGFFEMLRNNHTFTHIYIRARVSGGYKRG